MKFRVVLVLLMCGTGLVKSDQSSFFNDICKQDSSKSGSQAGPMRIINYGTSKTTGNPISYFKTSNGGIYQLPEASEQGWADLVINPFKKAQEEELRKLAILAFTTGLEVYVCVEGTSPNTVWLMELVQPQQ